MSPAEAGLLMTIMLCPMASAMGHILSALRALGACPLSIEHKLAGLRLTLTGRCPGPASAGWCAPWGCDCRHRLGLRTAIKKYRLERKGRLSPVPYGAGRSPVPDGTGRSPVPDGTGPSFDTVIEYNTVAMITAEKTWTLRPTGGPHYLLRATDSRVVPHVDTVLRRLY